MPTVKDEQGNVVAKMPYNEQGKIAAEKMSQENLGYTVVDAPAMREQMYAGGGKAGYNKIGMYKKGGPVNKPKKKKRVVGVQDWLPGETKKSKWSRDPFTVGSVKKQYKVHPKTRHITKKK